jgi:hypothetical protein
MDTDLHHIIRSNQELSEEHCQVLIKYFIITFKSVNEVLLYFPSQILSACLFIQVKVIAL